VITNEQQQWLQDKAASFSTFGWTDGKQTVVPDDPQGACRAALDTIEEQDKLLRQVWQHVHGLNVDGSRRRTDDDDACFQNWRQIRLALHDNYGDVL
jgi:hypothetical protein